MSYTMSRGASNSGVLYTLRHGFDNRLVERLSKKGFIIIPAVIALLLTVAALTSNEWYGKASPEKSPGTSTSQSVAHNNQNEDMNNSSQPNSNSEVTPNSSSSKTAPASSLHKTARNIQPATPISGIVGGRGGGSPITTPSAPVIVPSSPVTDPSIPPVNTPETPITEPIQVLPLPLPSNPDPIILCTPNILGVLPSTCL